VLDLLRLMMLLVDATKKLAEAGAISAALRHCAPDASHHAHSLVRARWPRALLTPPCRR
jgi:hypothetical protein